MDGEPLDTAGLVDLLTGVFLLNIGVMALAFGVAAGSAVLLSRPGLASVFAAAMGFLVLLVTVLGLFRSVLVSTLNNLVAE